MVVYHGGKFKNMFQKKHNKIFENLNGSKALKNYGHSKTEIMFGIPMSSGICLLYCKLFGDEV